MKHKTDFVQRLRRDTRVAHDSIERVPLLAHLFHADFNLGEYRELLIKLYGFYSAIEPVLFTDLPECARNVLKHRRKSGLLLQDLHAFSSDSATPARFHTCKQLPRMDDMATRMGAMYVLEGATLGGQIIRRVLLKRFGDDILPMLNFYGCYGEKAGAEWRLFQVFMTRYVESQPSAADRIVESAISTFAALESWLMEDGCETSPGKPRFKIESVAEVALP